VFCALKKDLVISLNLASNKGKEKATALDKEQAGHVRIFDSQERDASFKIK